MFHSEKQYSIFGLTWEVYKLIKNSEDQHMVQLSKLVVEPPVLATFLAILEWNFEVLSTETPRSLGELMKFKQELLIL